MHSQYVRYYPSRKKSIKSESLKVESLKVECLSSRKGESNTPVGIEAQALKGVALSAEFTLSEVEVKCRLNKAWGEALRLLIRPSSRKVESIIPVGS
jgi:hypothetical protein